MNVCDVCGNVTERAEIHPGPWGLRLICPLCAGLGAVTGLPLTLLVDGTHPIGSKEAAQIVVAHHYLHRRPPISHAFGWVRDGTILGVCTYGVPASRHLQKSACPTDPDLVLELNRLWVDDSEPRNTESRFVAATLRQLPPRVIVSYADTAQGHYGYIYRALSWRYAGWTDMDRKTPRFDYLPLSGGHARDAMRGGWSGTRRRQPKVKYWTTTGTPAQRRALAARCGWPSLDWHETPPPRVTHLTVVPDPEGADHEHGGAGTVQG